MGGATYVQSRQWAIWRAAREVKVVQLQNKRGAEPFGILCLKNDYQGVLESQPLALDRNS